MLNFKLRIKNKATLIALIAATVAFIYQILGILNIVPPITEEQVNQVIGIVLNLLVALGIIVDPTTKGVKDSQQALSYDCPKCDEEKQTEETSGQA